MDIINNIGTHGKEVFDFFLYTIVLGIIGRKVLADWLINKGRRFMAKSERNSAIWTHYQSQARGQGHSSASVLDCGEGNCRVFGTKLQTA